MADMGFLPDVRRLLDRTHADRQTLLFSATLDGDVNVLVKKYQKSPKRLDVETSEDKQGEVAHHFWRAERDERIGITERLIGSHATSIVFCRTRHGADRLAKQLGQRGISAAPIHGSRSQAQRERALDAFMKGHVRALVATDVAARGIHVDDVSCVLHYDPPGSHTDYVHRSGRTGRAGADGVVVTLVSIGQMHEVRQMQKALRMPLRVERPDFSDMPPVVVQPRPPVAHAPKPDAERRRGPKHRPQGQHRHGEQRSDEQRRAQRRRRPRNSRNGRPPAVGTAR